VTDYSHTTLKNLKSREKKKSGYKSDKWSASGDLDTSVINKNPKIHIRELTNVPKFSLIYTFGL